MRLVAKKQLRYPVNTGRLYFPGDIFTTSDDDGRILVEVSGKAEYFKGRPSNIPSPPPEVAKAIGPVRAEQRARSARDRLRAEAKSLGVRYNGNWSAARLREEIETAKVSSK